VAGSGEYGDEPPCSGATELVDAAVSEFLDWTTSVKLLVFECQHTCL
jgi:hypothetical protein